jgi:rhomboid protease GluP
MYGHGPTVMRLLGGVDPVSIIPRVCIVLYVLALLLDLRGAFSGGASLFRILSPSGSALRDLGSTHAVDLAFALRDLGGTQLHFLGSGRPWTILTAIYLHGGLLHILFNLLWVRNLAPELQRGFGAARFFVIWTVAGAFGYVVSDLMPLLGIGQLHTSVGASGSIFGLLAALIVYGRRLGASLMTRQVWQWAIILGAFGFLMPGVDNAAHVGGFVGGWIAASLLQNGIGRPGSPAVTLTALALAAATALGFLLNLGSRFLG